MHREKPRPLHPRRVFPLSRQRNFPNWIYHARLSHPYLRRSPRNPCRRNRPHFRLVPPHPRPWRRAVHRSARPLRPDAMRGRSGFAGLQAGRDLSLRMGGAARRRGQAPARIDGKARTTPTWPPAGSKSMSATAEVLGQAAELPLPVFGDQDYPEETRLKYRFLDLRRERIHNNIMLRGKVVDSMRSRMKDGGLQRIPDADPDRLLAGRRARLPGAVAHPSRQVLRPAAGAAAIQAAADDGRLRPLFPDRALFPRRGPARRPPAGRILPARSSK